jgi:hypothetical protein
VLRDGDPLVHQMLLWLAELSPRNVTMDDIARWRTQHTPNDARRLEPLLAELFVGGVIDLSLHPVPLVTTVSERPLASPVARVMARTRQRVVNLRHEMVNLSDPAAHQLVQLLDGTRNRRALLEALGPQFTRGSDGLEAMLRFCARVSLLAA